MGDLAVGFHNRAFANVAEELNSVADLEPADAGGEVRRIHEQVMVLTIFAAERADEAEVSDEAPSFHDGAEPESHSVVFLVAPHSVERGDENHRVVWAEGVTNPTEPNVPALGVIPHPLSD